MAAIDEIMRNCLKAMEEEKNDEAAEYFTEDGVWVTPFGRFAGKKEIKNFLGWQNKNMKWTVQKAGNDIIISNNKAFYEHEIKAIVEGKNIELSAICAWEFDDNNKVKEIRTVYDRFSTLEQAATGVGKFLVNQIGKKFIVK